MHRASSIHEIVDLFARLGGRVYEGEGVTQSAHALQCAALAEGEGKGPALIAAALLHDLGHLWNDQGETPTSRGVEDRHEHIAAARLSGLFGPAITEPIRLHVEAKRYLCRVDPDYFGWLSSDSVRSLELQGGPLSRERARAFEKHPYAEAALDLRRLDDLAKDPGAVTPPIEHFLPVLRGCATRTQGT